jgi:hypothetical protein
MNGEERNGHIILAGKPEGKRQLGRPILKWILERKARVVWNELVWLRIWTSGGLL